MNNMQYSVFFTKEFKKQYKKLARSGNLKALEEVDRVIGQLSKGEKLSEKYRNHLLKGELKDKFKCHVLPDWLLIYRKYEDLLILELIATGSHSELF